MFDPAACFDYNGPLLLVQGSLLATQCVGMSHFVSGVFCCFVDEKTLETPRTARKMDDFRFLSGEDFFSCTHYASKHLGVGGIWTSKTYLKHRTSGGIWKTRDSNYVIHPRKLTLNGLLEKEIPIRNHHFWGSMWSFPSCKLGLHFSIFPQDGTGSRKENKNPSNQMQKFLATYGGISKRLEIWKDQIKKQYHSGLTMRMFFGFTLPQKIKNHNGKTSMNDVAPTDIWWFSIVIIVFWECRPWKSSMDTKIKGLGKGNSFNLCWSLISMLVFGEFSKLQVHKLRLQGEKTQSCRVKPTGP